MDYETFWRPNSGPNAAPYILSPSNGPQCIDKLISPIAPQHAYYQDRNLFNFHLNPLCSLLNVRANKPKIDLIVENGEVEYWISPFNKISSASNSPSWLKHIYSSDAAIALGYQAYSSNFPAVSSDDKYNRFQAQGVVNRLTAFWASAKARPDLSDGTGVLATKFTLYNQDGHINYSFDWDVMRNAMPRNFTIPTNPLNRPLQTYSTPSFYPFYRKWKFSCCAREGFDWMIEARNKEIIAGDNLFSPFVAAGWNPDENYNHRPAQWLGLMKGLNMMGAEFFYTGYFGNHNSFGDVEKKSCNCPNEPCYPTSITTQQTCGTTLTQTCENNQTANGITNAISSFKIPNYIWQAAIPTYAQATASRYEDILVYGTLMEGDTSRYKVLPPNTLMPAMPVKNTITYKSYNFEAINSGGSSMLPTDYFIVARRANSILNRYAITATLQPKEEQIGVPACGLYPSSPSNSYTASPTIKFPVGFGATVNLMFNARRQGSTYIYDRTVSPPLFYQLDGWHENTHPLYWCQKQFVLEAELSDQQIPSGSLKTDLNLTSPNPNIEDYTNASTYLNGLIPVSYQFATNALTNNASTEDYHIYIRCKNTSNVISTINTSVANVSDNNTASITFNGNTNAFQNIAIQPNSAWAWVYMGKITLAPNKTYALQNQSIFGNSSALKIDKYCIRNTQTTPTAEYPACP